MVKVGVVGGIVFWQPERKAEQATERSGVGCGAWSGGCQKTSRGGGRHAASGFVLGMGCLRVDGAEP